VSDLRAAARRVGEAVGHDTAHHAWREHPSPDLCEGCRAERAALVELERAVREEGDRVFGLVANHLTQDAIEKMVAAIRARGKEAGGE